MSSAYNANDQKSDDNAAKLAAFLLKQYVLGIDTFDEPSWTALLDYATVQADGKVEFTFKSGTAITV